jgi:hypothetical protein
MGSGPSFRQILEEKMNIPEGNSAFSAQNPEANSGFPRGETPFGPPGTAFSEEKSAFETLIASFLADNVNFKFAFSPEHVTDRSHKVRTTYGAPPPREKAKRPKPQEKTTLVKALKPESMQALRTLVELGATELKTFELLSESIVKRAFRRLALRLHPDQNPLAKGHDFRRAYASYSLLLNEIKQG